MGKPRAELLALLTLAACGEPVFQCLDDPQCDDGFCEPTGYCSFDDPDCPSGRRYGDLAGGDLGGTCVDLEGTATSQDPTTSTDPFTTTTLTTSQTSSMSDTSTDSDPVTTTPLTSGPDTGDDSSGPPSTNSGPAESTSTGEPSATTGSPTEISVSFGDRSDADFQDVVEDTSLLNYATGDNMGIHGDLHLDGNDFGSWQVALLRFDISALPQDVTIVDATLSLWSFDLSDPGEIDLHALTEGWAEGTEDQMPGIANWLDRYTDTPWTTEGAGDGTYDRTVLATFAFAEASTQYEIDLPPSLIEQWRDDANANFGLLMRSTALAQALYIPSSEAPDETLRPLLVVTYAP